MTVVAETAAGLVLVTTAYHTSRHIITKYYGVGAQLQEGAKHLDDTLDICEKWGGGFKPTDAVVVASTYQMLRHEEKEVEVDNHFPKYCYPKVVSKARQFKDEAGKLLQQTKKLSQNTRMSRSILQQTDGQASSQSSANILNHRNEENRKDHCDAVRVVSEPEVDMDIILERQSMVSGLEYEEEMDVTVQDDLVPSDSEASSLRFGEDSNSICLRLRGQNWILPEPELAGVQLSPLH